MAEKGERRIRKIPVFFLFSILSLAMLTSSYLVQPAGSQSGLVGWWRFNEGSGTAAYDSSGNNNHGILINGPTWVNGIGKALNFDGVDDYVEIPNSAILNLNTMTVAAWVKFDGLPPELKGIVTKRTHGVEDGWILSLNSAGSFRFGVATSEGGRQEPSGAAKSAGTFYHLAGTFDGNNVRVYVNGIEEAFASLSGSMSNNANPLRIGTYYNSLLGWFFDGTIDEVRIYNRALTEGEIRTLASLTIQVGLTLDGSGSILPSDFVIMKSGVASAIRNNMPHDGTVELTVIQFGTYDANGARVEVPPTVIDSTNYEAIATLIEGIAQGGSLTPMADGLYLTWNTMKNSPYFSTATKQVINLATDGYPNVVLQAIPSPTGSADDDVTWVRDGAADEGLEQLDAEGIGVSQSSLEWMRVGLVYPQPGNIAPPYIPGWVDWVADATEFSQAISQKIQRLVSHDIAVTSVITSKDGCLPVATVGQGYGVDVNVTVENQGGYTETFEVTLYAERGLAGYWRFDEGTGTIAYDNSSNNNHGTLINGPVWVDGKYGKALSFDGANDYVSVPDSDLWYFGVDDFSIGFWVYFNSLASNKHQMIGQSNGGGIQDKWFIAYNFSGNPNVLTFDICRNGETETCISFQWTPSTNRWYYLTVVRNGTSWYLYVNGVQEGSTQSNSISIPNVASTLKIGSDGELWNFHDGMIDEVRIYRRTLDEEEIRAVSGVGLVGYWKFDEGSGAVAFDSSGNDNTGTLINGPTWVDGRIWKALGFDGVDDMVNAPDSILWDFGTGDFTMGAWINTRDQTKTMRIVSAGYGLYDTGSNLWALGFGYNPGWGSGTRINYGTKSGGYYRNFVSNSLTYNNNEWAFVSVVKNSSTIYFYFNGNNVGNGTITFPSNSNSHLTIGARQGDDPEVYIEFFDGSIDEVRIYDRALSASEIWIQYTQTPFAIQTVTLESGASATLTFTWNTAGFAKGKYALNAYVWPVQDETDIADNTCLGGSIYVTLPGDVNADGIVDIFDLVRLAVCFGAERGKPPPSEVHPYEPNADVNDDGIIDIFDIAVVAIHFSETSTG